MRHEIEQRRALKLPTSVDWKLEVYVRLGLIAEWDYTKHGDQVKYHKLADRRTLDYCVAKVRPDVWQYVDEIFKKWE